MPPVPPEESRMAGVGEEFPVADKLLYFDAAAIAPVPLAVQVSVLDEHLRSLSLGTAAPPGSRLDHKRTAARMTAARLLSVEPEQVAIVSSAMAALRDALSQLEVGSGNVVIFRDDYPDLVRCCRQFSHTRALDLRAVESPCVDPVHDLAALEAACDEDTRLVVISNVHPWTGRELSIADLVELARSIDALLIVDASQAAGAVPIDAGAVDLLVAAGFKWLCGGFGAAVATASDRLLDACGAKGRRATAAETLEPSTMSPLATGLLNGSMEYVLELGVPRIAAHNRELTSRLRMGLDGLGAMFATPELGNAPHILSARFKGVDSELVVRTLASQGVIVSDRDGWVRWAPHVYTSAADVDRAVQVLAAALQTSVPLH